MSAIRKFLVGFFEALFGSLKRNSLEHRLFNTLSFLNAVTNLGGSLNYIDLGPDTALFALHVGSGVLFLIYYYFSRFRSIYYVLFWPFVLTMLVFLVSNIVVNAGSLGGAQYYIIAALVIATILARSWFQTLGSYLLFVGSVGIIFYVEAFRPDLITPHTSTEARHADVFGNFVFVLIFVAVIVQALVQNLHSERRKSEQLLLNILPETIAEQLKREDRVEPRSYEYVTVLFTDFVGFTGIAEKLTPHELIQELDECFRAFDQVMNRHGMEKIKTIGDAYMAAGGIPAPNRTNPVDAVLAALEISRFMQQLRAEKSARNEAFWELRLGIHTGPLVAGVIGQEKFAYDVWGDTVNTASRMESSGSPGAINISAATYELVRDLFECDHRGKISAKNKGDIDMYFVRGIQPELRANNDPCKPNERFLALYRRLRDSGSGNGNDRP